MRYKDTLWLASDGKELTQKDKQTRNKDCSFQNNVSHNDDTKTVYNIGCEREAMLGIFLSTFVSKRSPTMFKSAKFVYFSVQYLYVDTSQYQPKTSPLLL